MPNVFEPGDYMVGLGEILWDMLPDGKKLGGAPANFAYHAGQAGVNACAVSAIGDDKLGTEIIDTLDARGMQYVLETAPYPTGTVQVTLDERGIPTYNIRQGVAWDNIPLTPRLLDLAAKTRAVSFGSLAQRSPVSKTTMNKFMDAMRDAGGKRYYIFDINLRQNFYTQETLCESLERCNIMKINDEEMVTISRIFSWPGIDLKDKCWLLLGKYNLDLLVLTCGINGSYVFAPGQLSFLPTPVVEVVDTVGAGDSFSAIFMASYLQGASIEDAHQNAVNCSAYVCTQPGAMPELPATLKEQIEASIQRGRETVKLSPNNQRMSTHTATRAE